MHVLAHLTYTEWAPLAGTFLLGVITGLGLALAIAKNWGGHR